MILENRHLIAVAVSALAVFACLGAMVMAEDADAVYEEEYGQVYNMNLAPGYSYTYTPTYPAGLEVETTIEKYEDTGLDAEITPEGTLKVSLKDTAEIGTAYDLILKAHSSTGGVEQTIYQHLRFTAVDGLTVTPAQVINDIILGMEVTFQAQAETGATTTTGEPFPITWAVKSGTELPAGLNLEGNTVSGTPTTVGTNVVSLTASSAGQTADLIIDFVVYQKIVEQQDETIHSYGNTVSSTINPESVSSGEDKTGDITVTWKVADDTTDQLPDGFALDPNTGIISGQSTEAKTSVVKIVGTSQVGPVQTSTKVVTIATEPVITITSPSDQVFTYPSAEPATLQLSVNQGVSTVTWSVSEANGVTIDASSGLLTVTNEASAGKVTITATSQYGQVVTKEISVIIEEPLTISGSETISSSVGIAAEQQYTCNVAGVTWSVEGAPAGLDASIGTDGKLTVSGNSPMGPLTLTVKVTSANGQTATYEVTCQIVPQLVFSDPPTGGAIIYGI